MLRLLLARHGLTTANQQHRYIGSSDPCLSDTGRNQAAALAERLSDEHLAAIYSSPQCRARETAKAVAVVCGLEVQVDQDLREIDFGCWENLTRAEIMDQFPGQMEAWEENASAEPAPHGGESLSRVAERARAAFARITEQHENGEAVLLVAHGGILQSLLCEALGPPLRARWSYLLQAASLSELHVFARQSVLVSLNESSFHALAS
jgi:broad specificity phosphatase PhoE